MQTKFRCAKERNETTTTKFQVKDPFIHWICKRFAVYCAIQSFILRVHEYDLWLFASYSCIHFVERCIRIQLANMLSICQMIDSVYLAFSVMRLLFQCSKFEPNNFDIFKGTISTISNPSLDWAVVGFQRNKNKK